MKKKIILPALLAMVTLSSCVVYTEHVVTANAVGTKVGELKKTVVKKDFGGVAEAAKKGGISKIGAVDIKYYLSGKVSIRVAGE